MPSLPTPPEKVELRYAQVERLIAGMLDVHDDRMLALTARLRLFRQQGFPPHVSAGEGKPFKYDLNAVVRLSLAFAMMEAFVPQDQIANVIKRSWAEIGGAFATAFKAAGRDGDAEANRSRDRSVLVLDVLALHSFRRGKTEKDEPQLVRAAKVVDAHRLGEGLATGKGDQHFTGKIVIDIQRVASWVHRALLTARWADAKQLDDYSAGPA